MDEGMPEVTRNAELVECLAMIRHADVNHTGLTRECDECMSAAMREVYAIETPGVQMLDKKWFWFAIVLGILLWCGVAWWINLPFLPE